MTTDERLASLEAKTDEKFASLEAKLDINMDFVKAQLLELKSGQDDLQKSISAIGREISEHKGVLIGARWMIGVGLLVLAACGGVAGAVVSHLLKP